MKISVTVEVPDGEFCEECQFEHEQECSIFNEMLGEETRINKHGIKRVYYAKLAACRAAEVREDV